MNELFDPIANIKLADLVKDRASGEIVNTHVVTSPVEPSPDFETMRKLVKGEEPVVDGISEPA